MLIRFINTQLGTKPVNIYMYVTMLVKNLQLEVGYTYNKGKLHGR